MPSDVIFSGDVAFKLLTVAVTFTVPLVTAILTLDSLVKIANVAPAIRLTQSAMLSTAPRKVLLLNNFFISFTTPFYYFLELVIEIMRILNSSKFIEYHIY